MNRVVRILLLTVVVMLAVSTGFLSSQKKGQVQDPVFKLCVDKDPSLSSSYGGETYYFCSVTDRDRFLIDPRMSLSMMPPRQ